MGLLTGLIDKAHSFVHRREAGEARESTRRADGTFTPPQQQSVEELVAIMQASEHFQGIGKASTSLSDSEARRYFFGWQYAAATLVAETLMQAAWTTQVKTAGEWEDDDDTDLARLLRRGNKLMSGRLLFYMAAINLAIVGKEFWHIAPDALGDPGELWPVMGTMKPVTDPEAIVKGWEEERYTKTGFHKTSYEFEEIVWLRYPKPGTILEGFGSFQAAAYALKLDQQIADSEWAAMKQGIWPSVLIGMPGSDPQQRKERMREFNELYAGAGKTGQAIAIPPGIETKWPPTKPREMGYTQSAQHMRDTILAIQRVPAALVGLSKDVNRASAEALYYIFARWTAAPKLMMLEDQINKSLAPRYGSDIRMKFRDPVPPNEDQMRQRDEMELSQKVVSPDEYREYRGWGKAETWDGSVPYVPVSTVPITTPPAPKGGQGPDAKGKDAAPQPVQQKRGRTREQRRWISIEAAEARLDITTRLHGAILKHFRGLRADVLEAWDAAGTQQAVPAAVAEMPAEVGKLLSNGELASRMAHELHAVNRWGIFMGGSFGRSQTPNPAAWAWKNTSEMIDRHLAEFGPHHYTEVAETTRARLTEAVGEGLKENETWGDLRKRIVDEFGDMAEARAANIATTESTKLFNAGGQAFRDDAGIPAKEWCCSFVNSRDTHQDADGQVVPNEEEFTVGGDSMPYPGAGSLAEENCNCNCTSLPVVD